jgi:K+-transporting ATPase ATPase A chain
MTASGVLYIGVFFLVLLAVTKPLGLFMARVFEGERTFLHPLLRPLERLIYRLGGVRERWSSTGHDTPPRCWASASSASCLFT